ncbi:hypothetical protein [Aliiroseovarius sp.]|uniref:hypothetical protein n=1 Tax=Aliiroseovarius sp. TaxID=1872442 RepID=UPI00260F6534|nr:hypothetical protein [Aliiroseovarius sp.]
MTQPRQSRAFGYFLRVVGIVSGFAIFVAAQEFYPNSDNAGRAALLLGALLAFWFWGWGSRHLQPLAQEVMANDPRPPILYLRSFTNEAAVFDEERGFADMFAPTGPLVAIGQPGERLPPLGAARLYLEDDNWHECVLDLLGQARLVLIYGGDTPGLGWELRQVRDRLHPSRLTIMVPNDPEAWERFRALAQENADLNLPPMPTGRLARYASPGVVGFLFFDNQWNPYFKPLPKKTTRAVGAGLAASDTAAQSAVALSEIYGDLGVNVERPRRSVTLIYFKILRFYLFLILIVAAVVGLFGYVYWANGMLGFDNQEGPFWIVEPDWWPF